MHFMLILLEFLVVSLVAQFSLTSSMNFNYVQLASNYSQLYFCEDIANDLMFLIAS